MNKKTTNSLIKILIILILAILIFLVVKKNFFEKAINEGGFGIIVEENEKQEEYEKTGSLDIFGSEIFKKLNIFDDKILEDIKTGKENPFNK